MFKNLYSADLLSLEQSQKLNKSSWKTLLTKVSHVSCMTGATLPMLAFKQGISNHSKQEQTPD